MDDGLRESKTDPVLGTLTWDNQCKCWSATVELPPPVDRVDVAIYDLPDVEMNADRLRDFVSWLRGNTRDFVQQVAFQSFNMDLIWDDLSEEFVADRIRITHISALDGEVRVVADPRSFLDDEHVFHITLDSNHRIVDMHK